MAKRLTQQQLQPELEAWARDGLIDPASVPTILARYPQADPGSKMMAIFVALGVASILGSVALVISANWQEIGPLAKLVGFLALLGGVGLAAIRLKANEAHPGWWDSACTAWAVLPLLGLALVSQIFHTDGRVSTLLIAWLVLISPLPLLTRSRGVFAVFLIGGFFALMVDFPLWWPEARGLFRDFDVYCVAVVVYGVVAAVLSQGWRLWQEEALVRAGEYLGVLAALSALYTFGFSRTVQSGWLGIWGLVVALSLGVIYRGVRSADRPNQVNVGFVMIGLVLLSIYLRLAGTMMDTAFLFFTGGAAFLGIAWIMQRLRKFALAAAKSPAPVP